MPTVNELCKILCSLNRVYVFEIVLLLVPRLKIVRGLSIQDLGFLILRNKEAQEHNSSSQETNHNTLPLPPWPLPLPLDVFWPLSLLALPLPLPLPLAFSVLSFADRRFFW